MQVLGSFLSPGFFCVGISSFANALPNASPQPILNTPLDPLEGEAAVTHDDATIFWRDDPTKDAGQGTKAPTEQVLMRKPNKTCLKCTMIVCAGCWVDNEASTRGVGFFFACGLLFSVGTLRGLSASTINPCYVPPPKVIRCFSQPSWTPRPE